MASDSLEMELQQAVLDFTLGDYQGALENLDDILLQQPEHFDALLAKTEVLYAQEAYQQALDTALIAEKIRTDDVYLKTSLSRIWMQLGDKDKAEAYGAQAKLMSWKKELMTPPDTLS